MNRLGVRVRIINYRPFNFSRKFHQKWPIQYKTPTFDHKMSYPSNILMSWEDHHVAQVYHPVPVVFETGKGAEVWDPEGKRYLDFLSAYSAVNQGHCHPKIVNALVTQSQKLTLSSRAFYNSVFPKFAKFITEYFQYDRLVPMNSGAEAVETALKIARRWGHKIKGIKEGEGMLVTCENNFHGRTLAIISTSSDANSKSGFGPFLPGFLTIPYNDASALEEVFKQSGDRISGFLVEPIQGEAGILIPDEDYLKQCYDLCKKYNVLMIADEIQTGLGRTGRMLCCDHSLVKPDLVILGKALSGGLIPLSCVLANNNVMNVMTVGSHGSTYGGNPLASAVGIAAMEVLIEEDLAGNSERQGKKLLKALIEWKKKYGFIKDVRGKGLMAAIEIDPKYKKSAWDLCLTFKEKGLLAKPTHENVIRLAPPLVINETLLEEALHIIDSSLYEISQ